MKSIQVDTYAVGLGAAILTQFRLQSGEVVRVLADGGYGHGGYPPETVRDGLPDAFHSFGAETPSRLDLMIGTHYDGDHLKGLIPIARDESIELGAVWLPPLKDDTEEFPAHVSENSDYLALRFYEDQNDQALLAYFESQMRRVEDLFNVERAAVDRLRAQNDEGRAFGALPHYTVPPERARKAFLSALRGNGPMTIDNYERFFATHEQDAAAAIGEGLAHDSASFDSSATDLHTIAAAASRVQRVVRMSVNGSASKLFQSWGPNQLRTVPAVLASIRKSVSSGAITASHLHKLVQALRHRRVPIQPQCHYISAGAPTRFVWNCQSRRFVRRARGGPPDLVLTLLGPSDMLVEKHRDRLPVDTYLLALSKLRGSLQRASITPSNQLSYICTLEASAQRILISGDAGCYDFRDKHKKYYPSLLKSLVPLHIIQVAHHAGHNYDFYNALLQARFAEQPDRSHLLISHAVHDPKRPSEIFGQFIGSIRRDENEPTLLFTAKPEFSKVEEFADIVAPIVPPRGRSADEGNVRLSCASGAEPGIWQIEMHAVDVQQT